jgi:hypothetical protein
LISAPRLTQFSRGGGGDGLVSSSVLNELRLSVYDYRRM